MRTKIAALLALALAMPAWGDKKIDDAVAKAEEQLQKGKVEDARKTLDKLVSQNPGHPEALLAMGRFQRRTGQIADAAATLKSAADAAGAAAPAVQSAVFTALAETTLLVGSGQAAQGYADKAVAAEANADALAALARALVRRQDPAKALEAADKAVAADANSANAHAARGRALTAGGKMADAVAAFDKALALDAKSIEAMTGRAAALLAAGKTADALAQAKAAVAADANAAEALAVEGLAIYASSKNFNEAIAQAQQGRFLQESNPDVLLAVGRIFAEDGNLNQAVLAFEQAARVDPGFAPAQVAVIDLQLRKGETDAALAAARKLVDASPSSPAAKLLLGRALARKGDFAAAVKPLSEGIASAPNSHEARGMLGMAYQFTGQNDEALEEYKKAVALDPGNTVWRTNLGLVLGVMGRHEEGAAELRKVVETPGYKDAAAWANLGWIYRNMNPRKTEESVAAYKKALELDPKLAQAALGMGWAYSYQKSYDDSIAAFQKAVSLDSKVAGEAYNGIGWAYVFKRDAAQARAAAEKAKAAGRNDTRLFENLDRLDKAMASGAAALSEEDIKKLEEERAKAEEIADLQEKISRGGPAERAKAARELARKAGGESVDWLIYALVNDKSYTVRIAAADALGSLGRAGRKALPRIMNIINNTFEIPVNATRAELEEAGEYADLQRACKRALERMQ
jgi:superkiller protein 3